MSYLYTSIEVIKIIRWDNNRFIFNPNPIFMNIEHYTPVHLNKKHTSAFQFFAIHIEPLLLSLLILTGIIGSIYLFGQKAILSDHASTSIGNSNNPNIASFAPIFNVEEVAANDFDKYVQMKGKITAGQPFFFTFLQDENASRYVMEMGDGVRLIVTTPNLMYTYEQPGKYVIELKEIKDGLLHIIGTKKIKVK
ncbi:MAG: hypothetical protein J5I52_00660 [Saprospiraceae bacterium]|nr:MAG: hypothetical protein UZ09_BCD002000796 [Bacteroidetes bacterium OLB9]MCO6462635.1 hypothetical protein [Saprospiraceae bacterium]MCZ2339885.1 hypothetical protein [Chitinophagales bacterium]